MTVEQLAKALTILIDRGMGEMEVSLIVHDNEEGSSWELRKIHEEWIFVGVARNI